MRIGFKLVASFWMLAMLLAITGYLTSRQNEHVRRHVEELGRNSLVQIVDAAQTVQDLNAIHAFLAEQLALSETDSWDDAGNNVGRLLASAHQSIDRSLTSYDEVGDQAHDLENRFLQQQKLIREVSNHLREGDKAAAAESYGAMRAHYLDALLPQLRQYQRQAERMATRHVTAIGSELTQGNRYAAVATLIAMTTAILLGLFTARTIGHPLAKLRTAALEVGQGNFSPQLAITSRDELGQLAVAFQQMAADLRQTTVSKTFMDNIVQSMSEILIVLDAKKRVRLVNRAALVQLGWDEDHLKSLSWDDLVVGSDRDAFGHGQQAGECAMITSTGEHVPAYFSLAELRNSPSGQLEGYVCVALNIAERKQAEQQLQESLHEKDILLREIHHRVKNNLQVISSLLNLQASQTTNPGVAELLAESQHRIRSIALIHEQLSRAENLGEIDFRAYVTQLCSHLQQTLGQEIEIIVDEQFPAIFLPLGTAMPCGMIVNELVYNAGEHAFLGGRGKVTVSYQVTVDGTHQLSVQDNGTGIGASSNEPSLGLQLVVGLIRQLRGTLDVQSGVGTCFAVKFKLAATEPVSPVVV